MDGVWILVVPVIALVAYLGLRLALAGALWISDALDENAQKVWERWRR